MRRMIANTRIMEIADHYGIEKQLHQLAEECSELAVEASHSARKGVTVKIIEEMADVLIMMEQVIYLANIAIDDIDECISFKIDRQMKRIKEEEWQTTKDRRTHTTEMFIALLTRGRSVSCDLSKQIKKED